ncbi:hypothetical protein Bca101_035924 [Brassica carinata]
MCLLKRRRFVDVLPETEDNHHHRRREPPGQGLSASVIAAFPTFSYKPDSNDPESTNQEIECPVCLGLIPKNVVIKVLPNCKHMFDEECIGRWLETHVTCPVCRRMAEPTGDKTLNDNVGGEFESKSAGPASSVPLLDEYWWTDFKKIAGRVRIKEMGFNDPSLSSIILWFAAVTSPLIISVIFIFLCMCFLKRRRFVDALPETEDDHHHRRETPCQGLSASVIAAFPTFSYKPDNNDTESNNQEIECPVCLRLIPKNVVIKVLPNCKHMFDEDCIGRWLQTQVTCPVCRRMAEPMTSTGDKCLGFNYINRGKYALRA